MSNFSTRFSLGRFFWPEGLPESDSSPWLSSLAQNAMWWMLVAFAAVDVIHPISTLTGSWWFAFFVLWTVPWRQPVDNEKTWVRIAVWLSALLLFGWLIYRIQTAAYDSLKTWQAFGSLTWWMLLSFPMRTALASCVTAALLAIPIRRLSGDRATAFAIIASLPYALTWLPIRFAFPPKWAVHTVAAGVVDIGCCLLSFLIVAEACSLLSRFPPSDEPFLGYRRLRKFTYGLLNGKINALLAVFVLYCGALAAYLLVERLWDARGRSPSSLAIYSVILPASIHFVMLSALATWRSLARAGRRHVIFDNMATFGRLAVLSTTPPIALFGFFFLMPVAGKELSDGIRLAPGRPWSIAVDGHLLRLTGEFVPGVGEAVEAALDENLSIRVLVLQSPGGDMDEGYRIAKAVRLHNLSTGVSHECASACTEAFVAGHERILIPGTRLGFHACRETVWYDECNDHQYKTFMARNGIDPEFVKKAMAVPASSIWFPTVEQLMAAHVVTRTTRLSFDNDPAPLRADATGRKSTQ